MENPRTLSGVNGNTIDQIVLPSTIDAILIDGNPGERGQVIAKNNITNKLEWDKVDDISIPDNSISGDKLKTDITFTTTGLIRANQFFSNSFNYPQNGATEISINSGGMSMTGSSQNILIVGDFTTTGGDLKIQNGGKVILYSDGGSTTQIELNGTNGNITSTGNTTLHNTTIENALIVEGNGIFATDIKGSSNANTPYTYTLTGSTGNFTCNDITCNDITINNHTGFDEIRLNKIELPRTGAVNIVIDSGGIAMTGSTQNIVIVGDYITTGGDYKNYNGGNLILYSDAGTTSQIDLDGGTGDITSTNGDLTLTNGDITCGGNYNSTNGNVDLVNGSLILENGVAFIGNLGGGNHRITLNGANGRIDCESLNNAGDYTSTTGDISLTSGNIGVGGNYTSTTGNITLTGGAFKSSKVGSKPAPEDASYTDWAINISDDNGHQYIGGNLIVNGKIFGDIEGSITEEIIDAQRINLREGTPSVGSFIGMEIRDSNTNTGEISMRDTNNNYNFRVYSGGNVDIAGAIVWNGATFNNVNGGNILMNDGKIKTDNSSTSVMDLDFDAGSISIRNGTSLTKLMNISDEFITIVNPTTTNIGLQLSDTFFRLNDSSNNTNNPRVIIESVDGISLISGSAQYNLTLSPLGDITFGSNAGEIIGRDAGSSSTNLINATNMKNMRIDESNFIYHERAIALSKPTNRIEKRFNTTSTSWFEINDKLFVKLKTNNMSATNFIVDWSYYAVKDDGSRLWAKLYDIDATSPEDINQPSYLNNTKQVLFDGGADRPQQHHATFTMRNVSANVNKNIGLCVWTIHNSGSYIYFFLGPTTFSGNPPTGGAQSSYAYGGMTLQIKKLYGAGATNQTPTGWSNAADEEEDDY